jgi:O-antigen/teichoic acid export membrane protein
MAVGTNEMALTSRAGTDESSARTALVSIATLGSTQLIAILVMQLAVLLLIRAVGPELAGRYNAALAITTSLSFLIGWGTSAALIRHGAINPDAVSAFAARSVVIRLLAYVPFTAVVVGLAFVLGWPREAVWLVALASLVALGTSIQQVVKALLEVRQRFIALAGIGALHAMLVASLITGVVLWGGGSLTILLCAHGAMELLLAGVWLWQLGVMPDLRSGAGRLVPVVRESLPYVLGGVFYALNFRIDAVAIASLRGETAAGYYTAASRIVMLGFMLPLIVSTVLRSRFFALAPRAPGQLATMYAETSRFSAALSLPLAVVLAVVPTWLVVFLFGEAFAPGGLVLMVLGPVVVLRALAVPAGDVITAHGGQHIRIRVEGLSTVGNLVMNLALIPLAGILGAALATLGAELLLVLWLRRAAGRMMHVGVLSGLSLRPVVAAVAMGGTIIALVQLGVHALAAVVAGAVLYLCLAVPLGVIHLDDLRKLRAQGVAS